MLVDKLPITIDRLNIAVAALQQIAFPKELRPYQQSQQIAIEALREIDHAADAAQNEGANGENRSYWSGFVRFIRLRI